jgi:hypothetical protein
MMFSIPATVRFREVMDKQRILLVNLAKGHLGEENSALLGAFIVAHLQKAALARPFHSSTRPFFLYLDEFQNYTTPNIREILEASRKFNLSLVLAHQSLEQLEPGILGAVLNTTGSLACFRVGYRDAVSLAHELFAPGDQQRTLHDLQLMRFGPVPVPFPVQHQEPLADRELVTLLTHLKNREFWTRQRGPYRAIKQRTLAMPVPVESEGLWQARQALIQASGERYGRLKSEIGRATNDERFHAETLSFFEEIPPAALSEGQ